MITLAKINLHVEVLLYSVFCSIVKEGIAAIKSAAC